MMKSRKATIWCPIIRMMAVLRSPLAGNTCFVGEHHHFLRDLRNLGVHIDTGPHTNMDSTAAVDMRTTHRKGVAIGGDLGRERPVGEDGVGYCEREHVRIGAGEHLRVTL